MLQCSLVKELLDTKSNLGSYLRIDPFENYYFKCDENFLKYFCRGMSLNKYFYEK
jgi:hypothetical protein